MSEAPKESDPKAASPVQEGNESGRKEASSKKHKEPKVILKVSGLTRNVKAYHLEEIFSRYGKVVKVYFGYDKSVSMPTGSAHIKFESHKAAKEARKYMDGAQIDGARITASLTSSIPEEEGIITQTFIY